MTVGVLIATVEWRVNNHSRVLSHIQTLSTDTALSVEGIRRRMRWNEVWWHMQSRVFSTNLKTHGPDPTFIAVRYRSQVYLTLGPMFFHCSNITKQNEQQKHKCMYIKSWKPWVKSYTSYECQNRSQLFPFSPRGIPRYGTVKADSHITCRAHAVPLPCRAAKGLECVFPIWFMQCARVWSTLAMPRPCHALTMPFFSRPVHSTSVERRPVGYLPAFGFFRLPHGVPRRLFSEAYQFSLQRSIPTTVQSGSSTLQKRQSVKLLD
jgi:hypothetical protein